MEFASPLSDLDTDPCATTGLVAGSGGDGASPAASRPDSSRDHPRILAVDDQRDSLRQLEIRLRRGGFECVPCLTGLEALDFLSREIPDVIITDVIMPGLDGFELCRRVKADPRTADIPVLFLTASSEMDEKVRGLEVGGHDYLSKPVEQQELIARTRAALRVKQLQDELKKKLELQREVNRLHQGLLSEHWQKTFGTLATSLAHEINNPLAVALGTVQLLAMDAKGGGDLRSRLRVIDQSLQRAAHKLRSLLLIAHNRREPAPANLGELTQDLLALINYRVITAKITLRPRIESHCFWHGVSADLGRALLYIIDNAIESVSGTSHPQMTVIVERAGSHCHIRVADTGPGLSAEAKERLFEPFFTTKGSPHSGIGLHLAAEIVRRGGGRIEVREKTELGSVEFIVVLPASEGSPGTRHPFTPSLAKQHASVATAPHPV